MPSPTDGAIVEDLYTISRGGAAEKINLYLSRADDYLRPNEGVPVGQFTSGTTEGEVTRWTEGTQGACSCSCGN